MNLRAPQDAAADISSEVTVAVLGDLTPHALELGHALTGLAPGTRWTVIAEATISLVDIALCDTIAAVADAASRWPSAGIIAVVDRADDGSMVVAALQAGADVCMQRADARLAAAYVHSVARRRELNVDRAAKR